MPRFVDLLLICILNAYYRGRVVCQSAARHFPRGAVLRGVSVHLTQFSDYSLRLAIYLACHPERVVSVEEISRAFEISRHHLVKVVQTLTDLGVVDAQRGRGGGMRLAMRPSEINVGWLIRRTEPHFNLVECFDPETNTCPIAPACGLKGALHRAQQAFLCVLDEYSLDQLVTRRADLSLLLEGSLRRQAAAEDASQDEG
jgi:Rrf2 family transcriptional regulator, nitric oxide-sensitive transcriptional repressor